jgi:AraC-like DNA-binding protein
MSDRPSVPGTSSALALRALIRALNDLGYAGERVVDLAHLGNDVLVDPQTRIPSDAVFAIWDAVIELTGDPMIGLRVAERITIGAVGAYEYLLRNSANLRAVLERADRFRKVVSDLDRISVFEDGDEARIRMWRDGGYPIASQQLECIFLVIVRIAREHVSQSSLRAVTFSHKPHGDPALYARYFGCRVRFEAAHNELVVARHVLESSLVGADAELAAVLEDHVQRLLRALPEQQQDPLVSRVRSLLLSGLSNGGASFDELATTLHMSPRTLRRKLTEHGVAYKTLLDDVRRDLALYYVTRNEESFDAVAERLGFSEPSTFYRTFKRWTGTTPALYRSRQQAGE